MKTCPNCGNKVSDTAKFCVECGTKLEEKKEIYCPNCNSLFTSGKFCMECGYNMQEFLNKKKVEKKNDDLLLGSLDFDPFGKSSDFDFDNTSSLLDNMLNKQSSEKALRFFEYEKYGDNNYIITKFVDELQTSIVVPDNVVSIENNAFENSLVTDIKLPEGLKKIGARAFAGCKFLKKLNIPSTVVRIDDEAFIDCVKLEVEIPNGVQILGDNLIKNTLTEKKAIKKAQDEEKARIKAEQERLKKLEEERLAKIAQAELEARLLAQKKEEEFNKKIDEKIKELRSLANQKKITFKNEFVDKIKSSKDEKELIKNCSFVESLIRGEALLSDKDYLYETGLSYLKGNGVKKDEKQGAEYLKKSADLGHILANLEYGNYLYDNKKYSDSVKYLELAYKNGNYETGERLGKIYSTRLTDFKFTKKDDKIALAYFIKAAEKKMYYSTYEVAYMYYYGYGCTQDYKKAKEYLEKSVEQNHPQGNYLLADLYDNGYGITKNKSKAFTYYLKASELGHEYSSYCVGWAYKYGEGTTKNLTKAVEYFKKSMNYTNHSKYEVAKSYYYGSGLTQNYAEATKLFLELANANYSDCFLFLGDIYCLGQGTSMDDAKAVLYYKKALQVISKEDKPRILYNAGVSSKRLKKYADAYTYYKESAELGYVNAMNNLGVLYENGEGTTKNIKEAMKWYEKAGAGGNKHGYSNLGAIYRYGRVGVNKDLMRAKIYYEKAKKNGNEEASEKIKQIQNEISDYWASYGLCRHCGGEFGGVFTKKCKNCGREKDYISY